MQRASDRVISEGIRRIHASPIHPPCIIALLSILTFGMIDDDSATSSPASVYLTPLLLDPEFEMRSGVYTFANAANDAAMDLHGSDSKSIIGEFRHSTFNQS